MKTYTVEVDDQGTIHWYTGPKNRLVLHRDEGPAIEYPSGAKEWFQNGELHRNNGPAVEWAEGTKFWYHNGELHRTVGPAIEWLNGTKAWFQNGKRHRTDGPAVERADGTKIWYLNGQEVTEEEVMGPKIEIEGQLFTLNQIKKALGV